MKKRGIIRLALFIGLIINLNGCAAGYHSLGFLGTGYHSSNLAGGYKETQIDQNTYRISFKANPFTSYDTLANYILYRCAEFTQQHGYDYFIVLDNQESGQVSGAYITAMDPSFSKTIKVFHGKKPEDQLNAYDAKEVMRNLQQYVKK